jgi:hypothetical protein
MLDCQDDHIAQVRAARRQFADMAAGWRAVSGRSAPRARAEAEAQIFNQMVVALAGLLPDGPMARDDRHAPAMAEARLLARGVLAGGVFPDSGPWAREVSVTGLGPGDRIALTEEAFSRLAGVCLDGLARRMAAA